LSITRLLDRAGHWFLYSGIQEPSGGVARYYRADLDRNEPISTEITGYAVSAFLYLHFLGSGTEYLERAARATEFLLGEAWDASARTFLFECTGPPRLAYFFDCGIIVRALLAAWRTWRDDQLLSAAVACGRSMIRYFGSEGGRIHPIFSLDDERAAVYEPHWSRAPGCYQLKAALAWYELSEETGDAVFAREYCRQLELALENQREFLPGHPDRHRVMDRLHAYCYFLEGLLPHAREVRCAEALAKGVVRVATHLGRIAPSFARSDVYAQLLRIRCFADQAGVLSLNWRAAREEACKIAAFQLTDADRRKDGGFAFGRKGGAPIPHVNPVSTAFGLQALAMWEQHCSGSARTDWRMLI